MLVVMTLVAGGCATAPRTVVTAEEGADVPTAGEAIPNSLQQDGQPCIYKNPKRRGLTVCRNTLFGKPDRGTDLRGIDLKGAVLAGSSFLQIDFSDDESTADLTDADLSKTKFGAVTLFHADMSGAKLDNMIIKPGKPLTPPQPSAQAKWGRRDSTLPATPTLLPS